MSGFDVKKRILWQASVLRRYVNFAWKNAFACWIGKSMQCPRLPYATSVSSPSTAAVKNPFVSSDLPSSSPCCDCDPHDKDGSDLVALKISLLGDCQIGKTSFLRKYVGREKGSKESKGLNQMDKTLCVRGARIGYSIWEVDGHPYSPADQNSHDQLPIACKDSVALLFMFDLTSRCTLNSVIEWYQQARKWNQTAIPVLVGTKFDDFVQLPIDLQWTIASQARAYAKALNATLFFSSATYNINVNKIFKYITAKLFNLPWTLERNLTIGEPIIDF